MNKTAKVLLFAGLVICLIQVWLPGYYITGDGPSHIYNAQILHDIWLNRNRTFYEQFYSLSYQLNPNWLSHILLAAMMFVVNGVIAEKLLVTVYVLLFISGFHRLLKRLSNNNTFLPLLL